MKKVLSALILVLILILTLTACKTTPEPENTDPVDPEVSDTETDDKEPSIYPEDTRYYLLPDGSIYSFIDNPEAPNKDEWDPYADMLWLGYTFVRENSAAADSFQKLGTEDEWNGFKVVSAESGWQCMVGDITYPDIPDVIPNRQSVRLTGEITFTGKAEIRYGASGEYPEYIIFVLDEEYSSKMPIFVSSSSEEEFGDSKKVFFLLTEETHRDEIEKLLLDGKKVSITVTTDDFTWRYTDYGLSIDGNNHGLFNNIIDFKYTVK